ncbi:nucleotidyltransferase family protein [Lichenifustis flavocetrariae]
MFAAGLGTRMRPITDTIPKPLVKVGGKTMLDHMLDRLEEAGVERAVVNVHYRADQIEAALKGRSHPEVVVSDERELLLDQAGGIIKALPEFGREPFFICNTDALWQETSPTLRRLAAAWDGDRMDVLLMVASTDTSIGVDWDGDFSMAGDGRLIRRQEGRVPFVYAGVGIIKPALFETLELRVLKLAPFFFAAAAQNRLFGVALEGTWLHVGTPQAVGEAEAAFAAGLDGAEGG